VLDGREHSERRNRSDPCDALCQSIITAARERSMRARCAESARNSEIRHASQTFSAHSARPVACQRSRSAHFCYVARCSTQWPAAIWALSTPTIARRQP
jgi:hypothetical protein